MPDKRIRCCNPVLCCSCAKCSIIAGNTAGTQATTPEQAAYETNCKEDYTLAIGGTIGHNGIFASSHYCASQGAFYDGLFQLAVNHSIAFTITSTGLAFDYAGAGYTEYIYEGGAGATVWLKSMGQKLVAYCNGDPSVTYDFWLASVDSGGGSSLPLQSTRLVDAVDYPALTISHDGTGSPTTVNCTVSLNTIGFSFIGGTYDGQSCTLNIHNTAQKVVQCITSIGKGLTATTTVPNVLLGDSGAGYCNPMVATSGNLVSAALDVDYNKQGFYAWQPRIDIYNDTGAIQTSINNYNPATSNYVALPNELTKYWAYFNSPYFDLCKCHDQVVNSGTYCPNEYAYTIQNDSDPTDCVDNYPLSNCIVREFTASIS